MSIRPYRPNPLTPEGREYASLKAENKRLRARIAELTLKECPKCEGFGIYSEPKCLGRSRPEKCSLCDGTGKVSAT